MAYGIPCDKFPPYQMPPYNYKIISDIANNQGFIREGGNLGFPPQSKSSPPKQKSPFPQGDRAA